jgi:hypothetical protein
MKLFHSLLSLASEILLALSDRVVDEQGLEAVRGNVGNAQLSLSRIRPHAIDGGCDQGADKHGERNAKENFAAYH